MNRTTNEYLPTPHFTEDRPRFKPGASGAVWKRPARRFTELEPPSCSNLQNLLSPEGYVRNSTQSAARLCG